MKLTIKNVDKLKYELCGKSYIIDMVFELPTNYEWYLQEMNGEDGFSVSLNRDGEWCPHEKKWYYKINYNSQIKDHLVSANWFGNWNNVMRTFDDIINYRNLNKK